jgi:WD40 repeat protein
LIKGDSYQFQQTLIGHTKTIYRVIEIQENELISVSFDKNMKIWLLNNEKQFEFIKTINFQNSESECNYLKVNNNEFAVSSYRDKFIKFWKLNDYSFITINDIENYFFFQNMCLLDDNILCVGGNNSKGFYLIKTLSHQFIKKIFIVRK